MKTLLLTNDEVGKLLDIKDAIDAVEEGYKAFNSGEVVQPDYIALSFEAPRGEIDFKVGYNKNNECVSMKASSGGFANNQVDFGLPPGMNTVLVWDGRSCALKCIMDGTYITGYRTGAAGAISVKYLARKNAEVVASIGTGNQARNQIKAIREVMDIKEIHAYDEFEQSMVSFKEALREITAYR